MEYEHRKHLFTNALRLLWLALSVLIILPICLTDATQIITVAIHCCSKRQVSGKKAVKLNRREDSECEERSYAINALAFYKGDEMCRTLKDIPSTARLTRAASIWPL